MTYRFWFSIGLATALAAGARAEAQGAPPKRAEITVEIPRTLRPPPGMCRVWVDNVPAGQQPAPTDCASAIRNRPPNGRVIFAEDRPENAKARDAGKKDAKNDPKSDGKGKKADDRPPRERDPGSPG